MATYEKDHMLIKAFDRRSKLFSEKLYECLEALLKYKHAKPTVSFTRRRLSPWGLDMMEFSVHFGKGLEEGKDIFRFGVNVREASSWLQKIWPVPRISNSEADFMLMHHTRADMFRTNEAFLKSFVNCLDFDEDENVKGSLGPYLTHFLVDGHELTMLRLLLDRDVNMEHRNWGWTPFQIAAFNGDDEIVAMFIYYNISPRSQSTGEDYDIEFFDPSAPILMAAENFQQITVDMLFDYTYDQSSDFDANVFMQLMHMGSLCFWDMADILRENKRSSELIFDKKSLYDLVWMDLFTMTRDALREILYFFKARDHLIDDLFDCFSIHHWEGYWKEEENVQIEERRVVFLKNLHYLASRSSCRPGVANPQPSLLHMMMDKIGQDMPLRVVTSTYNLLDLPIDEMETTVLLLLSHGAPLDNFSFELIFDQCRRNTTWKLFQICRLLEVDCSREMPEDYLEQFSGFPVSTFYHQFPHGKTIMEVLRNPAGVNDFDIEYFTDLSSHPAVKSIAYGIDNPELTAKTDRLPEFPTLLEFARDAARKYVMNKHEVKTSWQFYDAVEKLEIPRRLKKIVSYDVETPLYR